MSNVNEINYLLQRLNKLLTKDDIYTTDDKLLEVIHMYDNIYSFLKDENLIYQVMSKERYNFVYNKEYGPSEEINYELFKSLLELESLKGFFTIDYPMILSKIHENFFSKHGANPVEQVDLLLTLYLTFFDEESDLEDKYIFNHLNCLDDIINNFYQDIIDSKYVSPNEKDVLVRFNELYKLNNLFASYQDGFHEQFISFVNITWAYFIINNKIVYEYDKVMTFLNTISNHFGEVIFKLATSGIENDSDMLSFIKHIYEDNKVLNIKQIN